MPHTVHALLGFSYARFASKERTTRPPSRPCTSQANGPARSRQPWLGGLAANRPPVIHCTATFPES
eukprot:5423823-Ditylum_brightwellii.AAC.1